MDIINGQRQDVIGPYALLTPPGPIAQRTMREGPQLILRDLATPIAKGLDRFGDVTRPSLSLMFVPFRIGPTVVAVFSMQSYSINAYNQKDLNLLQTLANYCAGAIERIRLASGIPAPIDYPEPNQPLDPTS